MLFKKNNISYQAHIPYPEAEPDKRKKKVLEDVKKLVEKHMIHTPCEGDDDAYCRFNSNYCVKYKHLISEVKG